MGRKRSGDVEKSRSAARRDDLARLARLALVESGAIAALLEVSGETLRFGAAETAGERVAARRALESAYPGAPVLSLIAGADALDDGDDAAENAADAFVRLATPIWERECARFAAFVEATGAVFIRTSPTVSSLGNSGSTVFAGLETGHHGRGWLDYIHPDDREGALADWETAIATKRAFRRLERKLAKDGTWRWVEFAAVPLFDDDGAVVEWASALTDVHERVVATQRVEESEARYRAMVDALASMTWRADRDGRILAATGWREFTGQAPEETLGHGWLEMLHPEDREHVAGFWLQQAGLPEGFTIEYRARHVSGDYRTVSVRATPLLDDDGGVREWIGTIRDVHDQRETQAKARQGERRYRALVEATASMIWRTNADGVVDAVYSAGPFPDFTHSFDGWAELVHPDDVDASSAAWAEAVASGEPLDVVERKRTKAGDYRWCHVRGQPIRDEDGRIVEWIGAVTDIHERIVAEQAREASERRLGDLLAALPVAVYTTDAEGKLDYFNEAAVALWGRRPVPGQDRWCGSVVLCGPDGEPLALSDYPLARAMEAGAPTGDIEALLVRPDGTRVPVIADPTPLFDASGRLVGAVNVLIDLTERKEKELEVWRTANHDALTGIPNRSHFQRTLAATLDRAGAQGARAALALVDLDGFKDVNDTLGHQAGDAYLCRAAAILTDLVGDAGSVARIGGDEFAVLLPGVADSEAALAFAHEVAAAMRFVLPRDERAVFGRASVGVAVFPDHRRDAEDLVKAADVALYAAKERKQGAAALFDDGLADALERRVRIVGAARDALDEARFVPYYQPKIAIDTGAVVGFEALARWQHPERGLLTPAQFGVVFEAPDVAARIGAAMVAGVIADLRGWIARGLEPGRIAVNLSSAEFADEGLAARILDALAAGGLSPSRLEVEVTETVLLGRSNERVGRVLEDFQKAGVCIALDDFGTGYASLTHLKQFPVDVLKIDRSFMSGIVTDPNDAAIVAAVVGLGRALGLTVVAEGVETKAQLDILRDLRCDVGQGWLFAKPMAASRVPHFLAEAAAARADKHERRRIAR